MTIEQLILAKSVLGGGALGLLLVWERLRPAVEGPLLVRLGHVTRAGLRRLGRNLGLFSINLLLSPLIVLPLTAWAEGMVVGLRPGWWSGPFGLVLDVLLLDLWIYWWHRANHEWPPLWRFHEVHHLDETLDATTALRFHLGEVLLSALARLPVILLLDMPLSSVVVFEGLLLAFTAFHHSDVRLPPGLERRLARVVITPSIHWVHHHKRRADTDSNYGTLFSFWDPLFRTRSATARTPEMPIGVEGKQDRPLWRLLIAPFMPQPRAKAAPSSARR
jgi:sterol desaturase/sphingolipid hydroxylase (fatty acid hydroxylase superfamily)